MEKILAKDIQWLNKFDTRKRLLHGQSYYLTKRFFDLLIVLLALPFWLPLFILISLLIKVTSPGAPAIFTQSRIGRGGQKFRLYKFRTMVPNAEALKKEYLRINESNWTNLKIKNDPRVTSVGRILRKTSLDELPQLLNVIKGDMSLVGPRPIPHIMEGYQLWHTESLDVKPGMTGLSQIISPTKLEFDDLLRLDTAYIERASLSLDFAILFRTFSLVFESPKNSIGRYGNIANNQEYSTENKISSSTSSNSSNEKKADEVFADLKQVLNEIGKKYFKVSIGHPKLISKGFASPFLTQIYFEELTDSIKTKIVEIIGNDYAEHVYDTELRLGHVVKIKLFSPDIIFPEAIAKRLDSSVNTMTFLGKPQDTCQPREHKVILSIIDNETGIEYQSETFSVKVVDYAFDHVSRPLLSKVSAFVLGIGSFTMFILALLEQIDKTVGLTSGTAAGVLAVVIYTNFYNLYQRIRSNIP